MKLNLYALNRFLFQKKVKLNFNFLKFFSKSLKYISTLSNNYF